MQQEPKEEEVNRRRFTLVVATALLLCIGYVRAEFVWEDVYCLPGATAYNQGRRIVRNPSNEFLHACFDAWGMVYHSWSEDTGRTWLPDNPGNREPVFMPNMGYHGGATGLDPMGRPWCSGSLSSGDGDLYGAVKVAGEWQSGWLFRPFGPFPNSSYMGQTATAVSQYHDPQELFVAYTVLPVHKYDNAGPTYEHYLYLVAWYCENGVVRICGDAYELDHQQLNGVNDPYLLASVAVEPTWAGDIVHVAWQRMEDDHGRIYHIECEAITPAEVRAGEPLQWGEPYQVSQPEEPPTEPADNPAIDFHAEEETEVYNVIVVWHGPSAGGNGSGDVWRRRRRNGEWLDAEPVSLVPVNWESDYPEPSTRFVVEWQELEEDRDWNIWGNFSGYVEPVARLPGPDVYPHVAAKHWQGIAAIDAHTLWLHQTGESDELHYKLFRWIPRRSGPGGQSTSWKRIGSEEAELYPVSVVTGNSPGALRYFVPYTGPVELTVLDQSGRLVRNLISAAKSPGFHSAQWDATNDDGKLVSSGTYFCVLRTPTSTKTQPIRVMK